MKVFLQTAQGEQGPFSPAQINRKINRGEVKPANLCRIEGIPGIRPLQEQFHHLAPTDANVVAEARERVRAYNLKAGGKLMLFGAGSLLVGITQFADGWNSFYGPFAVGYCLAGLMLICEGFAQKRRAIAKRKAEL